MRTSVRASLGQYLKKWGDQIQGPALQDQNLGHHHLHDQGRIPGRKDTVPDLGQEHTPDHGAEKGFTTEITTEISVEITEIIEE